jgi:RND family efflux transporter MFP subunit
MRKLLLALIIALPLASAGADEVKVTPEQMRALGIETAPLSAEGGAQISGLPALVVVPNEQLQVVSAPLAGLVEQMLVAAHQSVKTGQVLARLQSPELADLQHTYLQAATQADLARANLERDAALFKEGIIAESRYLATRSRSVEAAADLAERTQALRLAGMPPEAIARLRAGQRVGTLVELAAPFDGVVLEQLAVAGQRLEPRAPVATVARLSPLWLEIQLPVARLAEVREGAAVAVPASQASGTVIALGRSVASGNQTVLVRALIDRGAERLRPGQYVEASLAASGEESAFAVPAGAVARIGGQPVVFVRTAQGFSAQPVRLLGEAAGKSIVAGLKGDERVAVKGVAALKAAAAGIGGE